MTFLGWRRNSEPRERKLSRARLPGDARIRTGGLWTLRHSAVSWAGLAAIAIIYLGSLVAFEELDPSNRLGPKTVADRIMSTQPERPARPAGPASEADESELRAGQIKLTAELRSLRRRINELNRRKDALESRLTALESALGPMTSAIPKETSPKPKRRTPSVSIAMSPMPSQGFSDTGMRKSPLPVATPPPPTRTMFAVELGSGPTTAALAARWRTLRSRHGAALAQLEARSAKAIDGVTAKNRVRLLVGPFKNAAGAIKLCVRLKAADANCKVTVFAGTPL